MQIEVGTCLSAKHDWRGAYMALHMIVPPALEGRARIIGVVAVHLNHLVEHTAGSPQMFVTKVISQD
jgi:hypothetical protein